MLEKEPEDLELTIEEIDEQITQNTEVHMQMTQNVGMMIGQLSDISHTVGRFLELKRQKLLQQESEDATKH